MPAGSHPAAARHATPAGPGIHFGGRRRAEAAGRAFQAEEAAGPLVLCDCVEITCKPTRSRVVARPWPTLSSTCPAGGCGGAALGAGC